MNTPSTPSTQRRRQGLTVIAATVAVVAIAWGGWHLFYSRYHQSTDNAYVAGHVVQITPQIGGTVVAIGAEDNDYVKAGQMLVRLDAADASVALAQAEAQLAQTVREVRALFANTATLLAQLKAREADAQRAQTELQRLEDDVRRRTPLVSSGAVGREEFEHTQQQAAVARQALGAAQAAVQAAREQLSASQAQTEGTAVAEHPAVARAAARVREADLALQRIALLSPIDGYVAKRGVQLGQRVAPGAPLMTVVALDQLWVFILAPLVGGLIAAFLMPWLNQHAEAEAGDRLDEAAATATGASLAPATVMAERQRISITPAGVHGRKRGRPCCIRPTFSG